MNHSSLRFVTSDDCVFFIIAFIPSERRERPKTWDLKQQHMLAEGVPAEVVKQRGPVLFCVSHVSKGSWVICIRRTVYAVVCKRPDLQLWVKEWRTARQQRGEAPTGKFGLGVPRWLGQETETLSSSCCTSNMFLFLVHVHVWAVQYVWDGKFNLH